MKTRLTVDVGAYERYVIAHYFAVDGKRRQRATRAQVRRFVRAALKTMIDEQASIFRGRTLGTARRLVAGLPSASAELLRRPAEQQPSLL